MKKKITALSTIIMLGLGSAFSIPSAMAATNDPQNIKGQRSGVQAGITKANAEISQVQDELAQLNAQINRVDQAIKDNNNMITQTEENMKTSQSEVLQLQQEVTVIKERIAKRNEVLKKRALSYQESGGDVSYLDVFLGASSFSDLVERIGAVATIVQADSDLVKQHEADKQEVEKKQASVEKKLADLKSMKTDLEGMQAQIMDQKAQNDTLKEELKKKEQDKLSQKADLQNQDSSLAAQETQLQQTASSQTTANSNSSMNISISTGSMPAASGSISDVINAGYRYIGNSVYVFGGGRTAYDIANGRFDCSGFVHWAFSQAGISVGTSTDSLKNAGTRVSASQMRPGDLVFFNTYKTDGHVGIYLGGGKFIGSQSSTGVAVADMSSSYWKEKFNGRVVRIINN
ncbi:C40 family peptidase [Neobacillus ginsengisoli]|uniref:Peptidoglycan hydrolase CwlO-like protein n=1 Tax=Neobacillus ginsengisoli TaxID=904295 RepID=A0ABT9XS12_9BACI|nr:C40 family peptidase [Neobacillus ginsengisoli]MDQ0198348.1 peptidoglycan hydrolase CwlO-like protein [Neobacillus ginsengisoli]